MTIAAGSNCPRGQHCSALTLAMSMTKNSVTTGLVVMHLSTLASHPWVTPPVIVVSPHIEVVKSVLRPGVEKVLERVPIPGRAAHCFVRAIKRRLNHL